MFWNHRVIHTTKTPINGEVEDFYAIHEVYSSAEDDNKIGGPTEEPVAVVGESLEEVRWTLERMMEALDKPVLDMETCAGEPM